MLSSPIPALACLLALQSCAVTASPNALEGSWAAESYVLSDGTEHQVRGNIFFSGQDWTVVFFVMGRDQEGKSAPRRGSAEGGNYSLEARDRLIFQHLFHLSYGEPLAGLAASPLRMEVKEANGVAEPCRYRIEGGRLELFFPSGNSMSFRRQVP
ncbi:MAG: hypothetical protein ACYTG5_02975 [Planctomycetota bacterium]|jgi:hypothetical protein